MRVEDASSGGYPGTTLIQKIDCRQSSKELCYVVGGKLPLPALSTGFDVLEERADGIVDNSPLRSELTTIPQPLLLLFHILRKKENQFNKNTMTVIYKLSKITQQGGSILERCPGSISRRCQHMRMNIIVDYRWRRKL